MANNKVKEETPNPYNKNKPWHEGEDKPFVSSNNVYFEEPKNKLFKSDDINEVEAEGSVNEVELESKKDELYKKPDYKKRYDDLKKHYDSKLNEFKSREQELLDEATSNRPAYKAPKSQEELEKFRADYPDVYEVVETVAHMESESKAKVLEERLSKLQERETELVRQSAEQRLMDKHPDFEDIRNSDDFHGWAKEQPKSIQDWIYKNADDADLASRALDLFKKDIGMETSNTKPSSNKPTKGSAADMVSTKTTSVDPQQERVWSEKEIAAMSIAEYDKYENAISEAWQEGRIIK
jgi:hypothetical protein